MNTNELTLDFVGGMKKSNLDLTGTGTGQKRLKMSVLENILC